MKKIFITISLFAMLGTIATSCQKENEFDKTPIEVGRNTIYRVCYSIDGKIYQLTLIGDDAWHDFLNRMFALAEEGHTVTFNNENVTSQTVSAKDVVTYTTTNKDEALSWAERMGNDGYVVTIKYDKGTGVYTCIAEK